MARWIRTVSISSVLFSKCADKRILVAKYLFKYVKGTKPSFVDDPRK